ncbi:hypothetical protein J7363_04860 [Phaeobacter italicus]|uniref:hypothetical protein n=1 Tax=Phaeobacter italicus TaxID=481446 RepID=UPI001ADCC944|nr:hypothetical protein [Phaeobacter italicus]MBO9441412.1 hypothetical protein [Phaeobacter italicus]
MTRLETGKIQEGDDWPGVFIRGDNALMAYAPALSALIEGKASPVHMAYCDSLLRLLRSADVSVDEKAVQRVTMDDPSNDNRGHPQ